MCSSKVSIAMKALPISSKLPVTLSILTLTCNWVQNILEAIEKLGAPIAACFVVRPDPILFLFGSNGDAPPHEKALLFWGPAQQITSDKTT